MPKPKENHRLHLAACEVDGEPMVDMRFWRQTAKGPRPTGKGLLIRQAMITRLIVGLQGLHRELSTCAAKVAAEAMRD